jgi:hypothetical protein
VQFIQENRAAAINGLGRHRVSVFVLAGPSQCERHAEGTMHDGEDGVQLGTAAGN